MHKEYGFRKMAIAVLTTAVALAATGIVAVKTEQICRSKTSEKWARDFVNSEGNEDILFIGTSQVVADIAPMDLWRKYGYTSYVICSTKDGFRRNMAMLKLALHYTKPKLVILNTDRYWRENELADQVNGYHYFGDAFPLSKEKAAATEEAFSDREAQKEILFPFLVYHNRWKELEEEDFYPEKYGSVNKGAGFGINIGRVQVFEKIPEEEAQIPEGEGYEAIRKFVEECKQRDIEVMLISLPLEADQEQQRYFHAINQIAEEYQIPYLNFVDNRITLNENTDYSNGAHLNISGARKITGYLGDYIQKHYDIPNRMLEPEYVETWGRDYEKYRMMRNETVAEEQDLQKLLLLCHDDSLNVVMYISGSSACFRDNRTGHLLRNIAPLQKMEEAAQAQSDYFVVVDYGRGRIDEYVGQQEVVQDTSFGALHLFMDEDAKPYLQIDRDGMNKYAQKGRGDIYICVYDTLTGEEVCTRIYKTERVINAGLNGENEEKEEVN